LWHKTDLGNQAERCPFPGPKQTSQADSPTSENDQRTHPLQTICTTRTVSDADARNPND
jgi:hypothetical protein